MLQIIMVIAGIAGAITADTSTGTLIGTMIALTGYIVATVQIESIR